MTRWLLIALASPGLAGCGAQASAPDAPSSMAAARAVDAAPAVAGQAGPAAAAVRVPPWDAEPCGPGRPKAEAMAGHEALRDRTPDELLAAYGAASADETYRLGDAAGLFRSSTANILPGGAAANADRRAREVVWTKRGCDLTVRFVERGGRWGAVEVFEAPVDTDY